MRTWQTKYVKTKSNNVIIFPAAIQHSDFSFFDIVSAGFVDFDEHGNPICYGKSDSLKLECDKDDEYWIKLKILNRRN